jgi:diguanylate cyclase (GGDEF)-like protein/PAS domain S-box-containing protein
MKSNDIQLLNQEVLDGFFSQISQGIIITDSTGKVSEINPAFTSLTGYTIHDLKGASLDSLHFNFDNLAFQDALVNHHQWVGEVLIERKDGAVSNLYVETIPASSAGISTVIFFREIHPLAYKDPLTTLPNLRCFKKCLNTLLTKHNTHGNILVLLYIDLDRFKFVNDTLGHTFGDALLKEAAERMKSCIRKGDTLARIGGDEFICLLPNLSHTNEAELIANEILNKLATPFLLQQHEIFMTASIGMTLYPHDGDHSEVLMTNADLAMYNAKKLGKNQFEWFKAEIQAGGFEKLLLENSLRKAIRNEQLFLVYQPQFDLKTGKINAVEALIRWKHPDYGLISPADFIPIAEETGLILPIGNWVIQEACRQNREWQSRGYKPIRIAVNLSSHQFSQQNLPEIIQGILEKNDLESKWLEIEITESMILQDVKATTEILNRIKKMGVHVSIDDFGTGYSSLSYLGKLPIDILKIDRSFIKDIENDKSSSLITGAIISLAHSLELKVVAEGVETNGQLLEVKKRNCDVIQGFLFSKPLVSEELTKHLIERSSVKC